METSEVTSFVNLPVYTSHGHYVGVVSNVLLDLPNRCVGSLLVTRTNTRFVEGGMDVAVPYRWVASIGDIVILNTFPEKVVPLAKEAQADEEDLVPA